MEAQGEGGRRPRRRQEAGRGAEEDRGREWGREGEEEWTQGGGTEEVGREMT